MTGAGLLKYALFKLKDLRGATHNGQNVNLHTSSNSSHNLQWSIEAIGDCNLISSLSELEAYLSQSNPCVQMARGTYTFDSNNTGSEQFFSDPSILIFTGSNNRFIFDNVTFRFQTDNLSAFGRVDVRNIHVLESNNIFQNLTMKDIDEND